MSCIRYGSAVILTADDGDGTLYNASLLLLEERQLLKVDKQEGVYVGGSPHFHSAGILRIHSDFFDGESLVSTAASHTVPETRKTH